MREPASMHADVNIRLATANDLAALVSIETSCFQSDRLSRRSFRHWLHAAHGILLVGCIGDTPMSYGLVWCHRGTRLARLYSLAVLPEHRSTGIAIRLMHALEETTAARGRFYMRLEVAKNNQAAVSLYEKLGYRIFGEYDDYYEDHSDALRMQKNIHRPDLARVHQYVPWYQQTTEFTCGPAALMMALASQDNALVLSQELELDLWRQATTIFMTSGHGGTHPYGLALAAAQRDFLVKVVINTQDVLFKDGVRSENKKDILTVVHRQFKRQVESSEHVRLYYQELTVADIEDWLSEGFSVIVLISTYQLDGKKAPHWVTVTHFDALCLYVHDPECEDQLAIDCQHVPIAREDFEKMSAFGTSKLRTAVAIKRMGT